MPVLSSSLSLNDYKFAAQTCAFLTQLSLCELYIKEFSLASYQVSALGDFRSRSERLSIISHFLSLVKSLFCKLFVNYCDFSFSTLSG